ncbi:MAG: hypothetical protein WCN98_17260, partial [Verrucomicrobiaceae bacterium]
TGLSLPRLRRRLQTCGLFLSCPDLVAVTFSLSPFPVPTFGKRENMVFSASFGQKKEVLFLTEWHEEKCEKA